jgi:NhaP-type Na+/H+ and K+/H+ antiporter
MLHHAGIICTGRIPPLQALAGFPKSACGTVVVASVASGADSGASSVAFLLWQFSIAPVSGYLTGRGAVALYNRLVPGDRGYYYLLFLVLTFVARPIAVFVGPAFMGLGWRNRVFISWAGLGNAVPIVLATYPAAVGIPGSEKPNLVFFAVLPSVLIQGSTLGVLARWLGLAEPARPKPLVSLELYTMAHTDYDLVVVDIPESQTPEGPRTRFRPRPSAP